MTRPAAVALPEHLTKRAAATSTRIAEALRQPPHLDPSEDRGPASPRWRGQSLSKGAAGVAILHGLRARAGLTGPEVVHGWLAAATREPLSAGNGAGLWYGATALAFALREAAPSHYRPAVRQLDEAVTTLVRTRLAAVHARIDAAARPALSEYDLVRGLTGLGAYQLKHTPGSPQLRQILEYLVRLTQPVPARDEPGGDAPGWWTSDTPSGTAPDATESGHIDLGMAHGITGPLALLGLAARAGVTVSGHREAIDRIATWLETWRQHGPGGAWWPERVGLAELRTGRCHQDEPRRPSWCYGTPGIARALQLAGAATGDRARQERAEQALADCLADPRQLAWLTDPAMCHGWAGVFTTTWHAAADARTDTLADHLPHLLHQLLARAPEIPPADEPIGLIEGSAGIAAALHLATTGTGGWETCLLIN
ncbi:lanthionine synthetase C family protein [Streptomyces sodiiphilus]|uniref:Lanthionine synthetase C family protein n=1 Tax=Streptomyces sodiiphilus TaxID=226217 RepID=A0ABP5B1E1_9ACTN